MIHHVKTLPQDIMGNTETLILHFMGWLRAHKYPYQGSLPWLGFWTDLMTSGLD